MFSSIEPTRADEEETVNEEDDNDERCSEVEAADEMEEEAVVEVEASKDCSVALVLVSVSVGEGVSPIRSASKFASRADWGVDDKGRASFGASEKDDAFDKPPGVSGRNTPGDIGDRGVVGVVPSVRARRVRSGRGEPCGVDVVVENSILF